MSGDGFGTDDPIVNMVKAQVAHERFQQFRRSGQMSLGQLITALEQQRPSERIRFEDGRFPGELTSYRGYYDELAIVPRQEQQFLCVGDFLQELKAAIGKTFTGYKGGYFEMDAFTPVWVSAWGDADDTAPVRVSASIEGQWTIIHTQEFRL